MEETVNLVSFFCFCLLLLIKLFLTPFFLKVLAEKVDLLMLLLKLLQVTIIQILKIA